MPFRCHPLISVLCSLIVVVITFLLQLIALTTSWWSTYSAKTELGKPREEGHYGLWVLCSTKAPRHKEDCDPLDTFFQVPIYCQIAGILAVIHLLLVLALLPLELVWAAHFFRNLQNLKPKVLCIAKVAAAVLASILSVLVALLISISENSQQEYRVQKGWSFWIQIFVICMDVMIVLLYLIENRRFWKQLIQQQVDPEGKGAETYGNPTFDADSPDLRRNYITNGAVSFTLTSGQPYNAHEDEKVPTPELEKKGDFNSLAYENESYQENSPGAVKKKP
ncbi:uncharacterized protein [Parasteatoda tepidariorum]|uniref:uncharacterized protein n=1 Tax=Parasteatoda tepidariorum TaxID=114398 RepID=UPI00077FD9FF|nr:uncharacterized protein LOC107449173 [Parasteatoda tepidariorum]